MKKIAQNTKGFAVLLVILIVSATITILAVGMGLSAINENQITLYHGQSIKLSMLLDACADEALIQLNRDNNYTGETLNIQEKSCIISVSGTGAERSIDISANIGKHSKNLHIDVTISPTFTITSWQETPI